MNYKIEKNIPLTKRKSSSKYSGILHGMEVGDSFVIEILSEAISFQGVRGMLKPKRFSVRQWEGKYRCWRVE